MDNDKRYLVTAIFMGIVFSILANFLTTSFYDLFAFNHFIKLLIFFDSALGIIILAIWFILFIFPSKN